MSSITKRTIPYGFCATSAVSQAAAVAIFRGSNGSTSSISSSMCSARGKAYMAIDQAMTNDNAGVQWGLASYLMGK